MSENEINEIIKNINDGDLTKRTILYNEYNNYLYRLILSKSKIPNYAWDDVNDIWVKIFNNLINFDGTKSKFRTWITFLAKNFIIDKFRVKQNSTYFEDIDEMEIGQYNTEDIFDDEDFLDNINVEFSKSEAIIIRMKYRGYSYSEICDKVNMKQIEVKRALSAIKEKLQNVEY